MRRPPFAQPEPRAALRATVALACGLVGCRAHPSVDTSASASVSASASASASAPASASASASVSASASDEAGAPCEDLVGGGAPLPSFPRGFTVKGLDASTDVAWATARDHGVSFAILQATLGREPNAAFARNWRAARACGMRRGAYHFLSVKTDPDAQVDAFTARLDDRGELPPIVDVELAPGCAGPCCETTCDAWRGAVARVLTRVEQRMGTRPIVYTVEPFWKECLCNTSRFAGYTLWQAGYPRFDAALRPGFGGWQRWAIYQAAGNVRLGRGVVDVDVFRGDEGAFEALLASAREAPRPAP